MVIRNSARTRRSVLYLKVKGQGLKSNHFWVHHSTYSYQLTTISDQ